MQTHFLFDLMAEHPRFQEMLQEAKKPGAVIAASGLAGAQKMHLACALAEATVRPLLVLCESEREAALPETVGSLTRVKQYFYGKIMVTRYEKEEQV